MKNQGERNFPDSPALEPMRPRDVDEISRTLASMDPWLTLGYKPEALSHYLLRADPALSRYCVIVSGRLAGVLAVRFPWLFGPFIELIALFGDCRGRGLGRALIGWVGAQHASSPNIWATVSSFNLDAREFYARQGFEPAAVLKDLIRPGQNEVLLRRKNSEE
ncbi:MAG: GNAT family N-acetyltransferase [Syntrophobacteraceae bacterium]